jgi:hypothetical protein
MNRFVTVFALACCVLVLAKGLSAEDPVVATVNGEALRLSQLENELLRQEGTEAVVRLVEANLKKTNWAAVEDKDIVVAMHHWELPRHVLTAQLLERHGGSVREELINILLIEQALRKAGVVINDLVLQAEVQRMEERLHAKLKEAGQPLIPFAQFIKVSQNIELAEYVQQPGFRMAAGLHALVLRVAEVSEPELQAFFRDRRALFSRPEQVEMGLVVLEADRVPGIDGVPEIDRDHEARLKNVAQQLVDQIRTSPKMTFPKVFRFYGQGADPQAAADGGIGFVGRDGLRAQTGAKPVPRAVMEAAFAADLAQGPVLMDPIPFPGGWAIAEVRRHRPARNPRYEDIKEEIKQVLLNEQLHEWSKRTLQNLRRDSTVNYETLGRLVHERNQALRNLGAKPKDE